MMSHIEMEYAKTLKQVSQLERELAEATAEIVRLKGEAESWEKVFDRTCELLAEAKEQLRLCNVDQFTTAAELAEAQEEMNDKRKFCYAVEQALDGMKGDYVEIIKELRKDAAMKEGGK